MNSDEQVVRKAMCACVGECCCVAVWVAVVCFVNVSGVYGVMVCVGRGSPIAQLVERVAVNRKVAGSNPAGRVVFQLYNP